MKRALSILVLFLGFLPVTGCRHENNAGDGDTPQNTAPYWYLYPSEISLPTGSSYNHINGWAWDSDRPSQKMSCSIMSDTCSFDVYADGIGSGAVTCNIRFTAGNNYETCSAALQVSDESGNIITGDVQISVFTDCGDGVDNDHDGLVDWPDDPGCTGPDDLSECGDGGLNYAIITADGLLEGAEAIRAYRESRCNVVELLTMSEIIAGMQGTDVVSGIKARISSLYNSRDTQSPFFVLLVGDADDTVSLNPELVPVKTVYVSGYALSDNWYADMDNDGLPEIALGRLPFRENDQVELYLQKLIDYEDTYVPGEWNRRLSFFAGNPGFGEPYDSIIEQLALTILDMIPYSFNLNMTYGNQNSAYFYVPDEFSDKVYERFNDGALFMTYIGHGSVTVLDGVMSRPILDTNNLTDIDPVGRAPIFPIIACLSGRFTYPGGDSLSEKVIKGDNGIVAVFSSTEVSDPIINGILALEMEISIFGEQPDTLGEGLVAVKDGMLNRQGNELHDLLIQAYMYLWGQTLQQTLTAIIRHVHMYTLFGDPALILPFPRGDVTMALDRQEYYPGETVLVDGIVDTVTEGQVVVSLETPRTVLAYPIEMIDWGDPGVNDTIRTNYENANNKVLDQVTVDVASGTFSASLTIPEVLDSGTYYIKAYAYSDTTDATGFTTLTLLF